MAGFKAAREAQHRIRLTCGRICEKQTFKSMASLSFPALQPKIYNLIRIDYMIILFLDRTSSSQLLPQPKPPLQSATAPERLAQGCWTRHCCFDVNAMMHWSARTYSGSSTKSCQSNMYHTHDAFSTSPSNRKTCTSTIVCIYSTRLFTRRVYSIQMFLSLCHIQGLQFLDSRHMAQVECFCCS